MRNKQTQSEGTDCLTFFLKIYRASIGFFVALVSNSLLPCTQAVWLGSLAVVIDPVIWCVQNADGLLTFYRRTVSIPIRLILFRFVWCALLLPMAAYFDSVVVYLFGVAAVAFFSFVCYLRRRHLTPVIAAFVLAVAILMQSQLLLVVAGVSLFAYLSWLSYRIFEKSLMFPFVLTLLGCAVIYIGIQYQKYGEALHNFVLTLLPSIGDATTLIPAAVLPYFDLLIKYATHLMWTSEIIYLKTRVVIDPNATPVLFIDTEQPNSVRYIYPDDTESHGVVLKLRASKPKDFVISRASLYVDDHRFWTQMSNQYGSTVVSLAKMIAMPLDLIPNYMSLHDFKLGREEVEMTLTLGTGANGTRRILQKTLRGMLQSLQGNFQFIRVRATFRSSKEPKYGNLFVLDISPRAMLAAMGNKGT